MRSSERVASDARVRDLIISRETIAIPSAVAVMVLFTSRSITIQIEEPIVSSLVALFWIVLGTKIAYAFVYNALDIAFGYIIDAPLLSLVVVPTRSVVAALILRRVKTLLRASKEIVQIVHTIWIGSNRCSHIIDFPIARVRALRTFRRRLRRARRSLSRRHHTSSYPQFDAVPRNRLTRRTGTHFGRERRNDVPDL